METQKIQWQPLVEMAIVLVTILGSTIPFYMHTDNKLREEIKAQNSRTDKLYEMWCETQKDIALAREEWNKKWNESREEWNKKWMESQAEIKEIYKDWSKERK
ncbi:MAG TPA: hypothetical protein VFO37_04755 [Chitinophagaceae bacterium]|nr:hypothetical protein [Chitinophagaceae bacterium]